MANPVPVPWPSSTNPGQAFGEGGGRVINCYAFKDGTAIRWKPAPGLDVLSVLPPGEVRGYVVNNGSLIAVVGNFVLSIDANGTIAYFEGSVSGSGPVTIARNNRATPQVTIASNSGAYLINGTVVVGYPDVNFPLVNSVTSLDGYFLWTTATGDIIASDLNDTVVNPLSKARAESRPDGLLRGVAYGQQFFAFGDQTIEVWQDVGSTPFPLTRSSVIPVGLFGQWAVAGFEDGWGGPLFFVAQDNSVRRLDGYTPVRVSNEDIERLIAKVAVKSDLRACVYTFGGNSIWSLSCADWTWEFNVTTGEWHERVSYGLTRWIGGPTINAFGKWLTGAYGGGFLYAINFESRNEGSSPLIWGMDSGPVKSFPERVAVPAAYFDFIIGAGAINTDPQAMLSWSHDGGLSWANPLTRTTGRQGNSVGRVAVFRLGLASHHGIRLRFRVSDVAYTSFSGAVVGASLRG